MGDRIVEVNGITGARRPWFRRPRQSQDVLQLVDECKKDQALDDFTCEKWT